MTSFKKLIYSGLLSITVLWGCSKQSDEVPPIRIQLPTQTYAEGDTVLLEVTQANATLSGVSWNVSNVKPTATGYQWIAPLIETDTVRINLIATFGGKTDVVEVFIYKRAFRAPTVSYAQFVVPLFEQNCNFSGCHGNGSRAGKVSLITYDSTAQFVKPYAASKGILFAAILRDDPLRWMPPAGKLQAAKIEQLRLWIEQGARNN